MKRSEFVILLSFLFALNVQAKEKTDCFRVVEYNVENLFDVENDTLTLDDDFTPEGEYHWTYFRYRTKLNNIAKTIIAIGEGTPPALVGLCEIENRKVLEDLVQKSPLGKYNYRILHQESPDARGVDAALLYQPDLFRVISADFITVSTDEVKTTRDILFARGIVPTGDTLHVFMNHWPSRRGGEVASEKNRCYAASLVREKVDSIFRATDMPYILIMGDFNDYPDNKSITEVLLANPVPKDMCCPRELYNLFRQFQEDGRMGTYKFQSEWNVLDQMIVSGVFMRSETFAIRGEHDAHIFCPPFLCVDGKTGSESSPFRTYGGTMYKGGFSDHFPIYTDFYIQKK
ncbi:MAG: endonuclease [Paludibacteraceae bacterium]|nr:endonuclease [Paludibacteraceae bacterium]